MKTRVIIALTAIPLFILLIFFAPLWAYSLVVGLISAGAAWEILRCVDPEMTLRFKIYAVFTGFSMPVLFAFLRHGAVISVEIYILVTVMFVEMMLSFGKEKTVKLGSVLQVIFAGGIMPMLLVSLVRIGVRDIHASAYLFLPYVAAFSSDSGAYFAGSYLGKHKLFPHLSPNKTLEGCIGGVVSAIVIMMLYGLVLTLMDMKVSFAILTLYGFFGSLACQLGDLAFSAVKREFGIKDYGTLIPGHGGMLDRFDSMHFTAPMMELMALLLPAII